MHAIACFWQNFCANTYVFDTIARTPLSTSHHHRKHNEIPIEVGCDNFNSQQMEHLKSAQNLPNASAHTLVQCDPIQRYTSAHTLKLLAKFCAHSYVKHNTVVHQTKMRLAIRRKPK